MSCVPAPTQTSCPFHVNGAFQMRTVILSRRADIDDDDFIAVIHQLFDFFRLDFLIGAG